MSTEMMFVFYSISRSYYYMYSNVLKTHYLIDRHYQFLRQSVSHKHFSNLFFNKSFFIRYLQNNFFSMVIYRQEYIDPAYL